MINLIFRGSPAYDVSRLITLSISPELRRNHCDEIIRRYYDEVKSKAGDKFMATFEQLKRWYERQFTVGALMMVANIPMIYHFMIKSEGEQKAKDEKIVFDKLKANYQDAMKILGL